MMKHQAIYVFLSLLFGMVPARQTISVGTVQQLIAAIGDDREILLQPGRYELTSADTARGPHHHWETGFSKCELHVTGVHGLTIRSAKRSKAILSSDTNYGFVLVLDDCDQVTIQNLRFSRPPINPGCEGGPLKLSHCTNVSLSQVDLSSKRLDGLDLEHCVHVRCEQVAVSAAQSSIAKVVDSKFVLFARCTFGGNIGARPFEIMASNSVQFHRCGFLSNSSPPDSTASYFFNVMESEDVGIFGGTFLHNQADHLATSSASMTFVNVQWRDSNLWRISQFADRP